MAAFLKKMLVERRRIFLKTANDDCAIMKLTIVLRIKAVMKKSKCAKKPKYCLD